MTLLAFLYLPVCLALLVGFIGGVWLTLWALRRGVLEVHRIEAAPLSATLSGDLRVKALTGTGRR